LVLQLKITAEKDTRLGTGVEENSWMKRGECSQRKKLQRRLERRIS